MHRTTRRDTPRDVLVPLMTRRLPSRERMGGIAIAALGDEALAMLMRDMIDEGLRRPSMRAETKTLLAETLSETRLEDACRSPRDRVVVDALYPDEAPSADTI